MSEEVNNPAPREPTWNELHDALVNVMLELKHFQTEHGFTSNLHAFIAQADAVLNRCAESPAPAKPSLEEIAKECAIEVLKNCAAGYINPEFYRRENPQASIDKSIKNATEIVRRYMEKKI